MIDFEQTLPALKIEVALSNPFAKSSSKASLRAEIGDHITAFAGRMNFGRWTELHGFGNTLVAKLDLI